jgi:hypothetical protein
MALRTPKWIALALSLSVALLALAACSGGDSTTTSATATSSGSTATHAPGTTSAPTAQATGTPSSTADIASQLAALGGNVTQATGKVTYTSTDSGGTTSTITFYSKPPNSRFDSASADGSTTAYIETPQTTYICTSSDQTCLAQPASGTGSAGLGLFGGLSISTYIDAIAAAAEAQGVSITKSSVSVAVTNASCYEGTSSGSTEKFCFSDSGVLLETLTTKADGTTSGLKATAFSSDVSDSAFQPPYPVTTIPAIPTG